MNKFLLNPFLIITLAFILCISLYVIPFSSIYPKLSVTSLLPLFFFVFLNLLFSILWEYLGLTKLEKIKNEFLKIRFKKCIDRIFLFSTFFLCLEFFYYGVPILGHINYVDFGAPFVHVIVVSGVMVSSVASSFFFREKKYMLMLLLGVVFSALMLNRFVLMFIAVSFYIIVNALYVKSFKKMFSYTLIFALFLMIFGELGLYRTMLIYDISYSEAKKYIFEAGYASSLVEELNIPASVFWLWLYLTSPISNLIYNVDTISSYSLSKIGSVFIYELLPETFSKRIGESDLSTVLLASNLNVSTGLARVYNGGWYVGVFLFTMYYGVIATTVAKVLSGYNRLLFTVVCGSIFSYIIFTNVIKMPVFLFSIFLILIFFVRFKLRSN